MPSSFRRMSCSYYCQSVHFGASVDQSPSSLSFPPAARRAIVRQCPRKSLFVIRSSTVEPPVFRKSAIQRISDKLRSLGYVEDDTDHNLYLAGVSGRHDVAMSRLLVHDPVECAVDKTWSTPENPEPIPGSLSVMYKFRQLKNEAEKQKKTLVKPKPGPSKAELLLRKSELIRLYVRGIRMKTKVNVGRAGLMERIVRDIHGRWKYSEVVKIKCHAFWKMNMDMTHELLERKTGGLVVWKKGSLAILYRGPNYVYPYDGKNQEIMKMDKFGLPKLPKGLLGATMDDLFGRLKCAESCASNNMPRKSFLQGVGPLSKIQFAVPAEEQIALEGDILLDGLGPRYTDWWGCYPLPIDADLLPQVVYNYRKPLRIIPYGVKRALSDHEKNKLKKLGRYLPCQFALGRNRKLQGLAAAIVKMWERCEVVKVAVKRGIQNRSSQMMAKELMLLTGGILLQLDRECITLYRGKDFLPHALSSALLEWRKHIFREPKTRKNACSFGDRDPDELVYARRKVYHLEKLFRTASIRLAMAMEKLESVKGSLPYFQKREVLQQRDMDREGITEEERNILKSAALKINPFELGRLGIFDGTLENVHEHWKYRELVKLTCDEQNLANVHAAAITLEAESGGILVSVKRVRNDWEILMYRGKNYVFPSCLRPQTLLRKSVAKERARQVQRYKSLKLHVSKLTAAVDFLKLESAKYKSRYEEIISVSTSEPKIKWPCRQDIMELNDENSTSSPTIELGACGSSATGLQSSANEDEISAEHDIADERNRGFSLSVTDRLHLREIALNIRNPLILFVGKYGVGPEIARAIKLHFMKHPFVIVSAKCGPKGISFQEVIFNLQHQTGALLVSQEPSKFILYRGWGAASRNRTRSRKHLRRRQTHNQRKRSMVLL